MKSTAATTDAFCDYWANPVSLMPWILEGILSERAHSRCIFLSKRGRKTERLKRKRDITTSVIEQGLEEEDNAIDAFDSFPHLALDFMFIGSHGEERIDVIVRVESVHPP